MPRTSNRVLWENSMRVLSFISEKSMGSRDRFAPLSHRQIADYAGISVQQARFLCLKLMDQGLISMTHRHAPDGGQLANGYALTARGRMVLREIRRFEMVS